MAAADAVHTEHEDEPWTVAIPDHPRRSDSPEYVRSREVMRRLAASSGALPYGGDAVQDHHGGGLWLKDADGWFMVRNLAGMEWSAQFCADPAKVDLLRRNAQRLYAAFPHAVEELGIRELLDTPITDAAGVARWCDSVCNASVPLPAGYHTGVPSERNGWRGGTHHFPAPVTDIQFFKRDSFQMWVTTPEGQPAAVAPVAHRGAGDRRVHVLWSTPGTALHRAHAEAAVRGEPLILHAGHDLARQAFSGQATPPATTGAAGT